MKIQALRFTTSSYEAGPRRTALECGSARDIEKARGDDLPAACLVRGEDLAVLRPFTDLIVDRGSKNKHKGLSEYLLGLEQHKIPLIDGNYGAATQLTRSVRALLSRARAKGEQTLYFIGAERTIFEGIWEKAGEAGEEKGPKRIADPRRDLSREVDPGETPSRLLMDLMARREVPQDLSERYVGRSIEIQLVRQLILHAAELDTPVLILGDTGTGKELVAREIHRYSPRRDRKFISVNCGAIPRELFESELFGHRKGSFTGATSHKMGLWALAENGTLFLDEIADLHTHHQVKILRALEENEIRPVGATSVSNVNARIIAATNRDLFSLVQTGEFRDDLYYRLRAFLIRNPALRTHREDIPLLAQSLWKKITHDNEKILPRDVLDELQTFGWPGNARELKMVLSNLRSLFGTEGLRIEHLQAVFSLEGHGLATREKPPSEKEIGLHRAECLRHLRRVNEVVHAAKVAVLPVVEGHETDKQAIAAVQTSLGFRLNELEILCRQPLLFHSEVSFTAAYRLKGKLTYFQNLLEEDLKNARKYWNREVSEEFRLVMSTVFREAEKILEKV